MGRKLTVKDVEATNAAAASFLCKKYLSYIVLFSITPETIRVTNTPNTDVDKPIRKCLICVTEKQLSFPQIQ